MKKVQRNFSASDRFPYNKGPSCNISNLVLICTRSFDWLYCEEYSVRYCTASLMYSHLLAFLGLAFCSAHGRI